jgi:Flp pilus assembly pilin Flp
VSAWPGRPADHRAEWTAGPGTRQRKGDEGATATEYALLVGFIAIVIAVAVGLFGSNLSTWFDTIASTVSSFL